MTRRFPRRVYAHRGASRECPENTLPSFARAVELGVQAIETDVHMTRDGVIVVAHDPDSGRMGDRRVVWRDVDFADARTIDLGWQFALDGDHPFRGRGVELLPFEELLRLYPRMVFNVDMKQTSPSMVPAMLRLLRAQQAEARVVLASFAARTMHAVRKAGFAGVTAFAQAEVVALLALPRAVLARLPVAGRAAQVPVAAGPVRLDRPGFIARCHQLGVRCDYWTINDPAEARRLWALGADGIMTDDPRAILPTQPVDDLA